MTGPATDVAQEWAEQVHHAAITGDEARLRALFEEGRTLFGVDLSRQWAQALSAYDSTAVTG